MSRNNSAPETPVRRSILEEDPRGRMDIATVRLAQATCKTFGPAGEAVWDNGLGELVETVVKENLGLPSKPLSTVDIARKLGLLPSKKGGR